MLIPISDIACNLPSFLGNFFVFLIKRRFKKTDKLTDKLEEIKHTQFENILPELIENGELSYKELSELKNIHDIASKADEYLQKKRINENNSGNNTNNSQEKDFNTDWFFRFYDSCKYVTDKQMQEWWARLLAGEISTPGSYSYRAMDTLKNLSLEEARSLNKIASYTMNFDIPVICAFPEIIQNYNYKNDLNNLYDCGILHENIANSYNLSIPYTNLDEWRPLYHTKHLTCFYNTSSHNLNIYYQRYTNVGRELFNLVSIPNDIEYFNKLNSIIKKYNPTINFRIVNMSDIYKQNI